MNKERIIFSVFLLLLPVFFTGCNRQEEPISKTGFYFDTVITVTLYDASATEELEECFSLAEKYENMLSATTATHRCRHHREQPDTRGHPCAQMSCALLRI